MSEDEITRSAPGPAVEGDPAKVTVNTLLAELHATRVATWPAADLQVNVDQRKLLVDTADRQAFVKAGDVLDPFRLPEVDGGVVDLDELLQGGPVVLLFFRFAGCPACNVALPHYRDALHPGLVELGATLVGISPQVPQDLRAIKVRHSLPFPIASDTDDALARTLGIAYIPDEASTALRPGQGRRHRSHHRHRPVGAAHAGGRRDRPGPAGVLRRRQPGLDGAHRSGDGARGRRCHPHRLGRPRERAQSIPGAAPPDPIAVRLPGGRTAGQSMLRYRSACPEPTTLARAAPLACLSSLGGHRPGVEMGGTYEVTTVCVLVFMVVAGLGGAVACGGDDSEGESAATTQQAGGLDDGGWNVRVGCRQAAPRPTPTSMEEWEALWKEERAAIVKRIKDDRLGQVGRRPDAHRAGGLHDRPLEVPGGLGRHGGDERHRSSRSASRSPSPDRRPRAPASVTPRRRSSRTTTPRRRSPTTARPATSRWS